MLELVKLRRTLLVVSTPLMARLFRCPPATKMISLKVRKIYCLWHVILLINSKVKLVSSVLEYTKASKNTRAGLIFSA